MDTTPSDLSHLFEQLGLPSNDEDIEEFIGAHSLAPNTCISDAEFWNDAQRAFIKEVMAQDNNWTELLDQLGVRLHQSDKTP